LKSLAHITAILVDLDGVVYRGNTLIPGVVSFFEFLDRHQIRFSLLTNNSTMTTRQYVAKLRLLGISVPETSVFTSGQAVASYLKHVAPMGGPVYVIGEEGLLRPIADAGFWVEETSPDFVVVGLDRGLTYEKLAIATLAVRRGAKLVAANPDTTFPTESGLVPGCGALVAALEASTDQKALVIGKPNPEMLRLAMKNIAATREETAILGDRLDTDVLGGKGAGIMTILVLTGVTTREQLGVAPIQPDLVFEDLSELVARWDNDLGC
jgi:HAD superfamily hydrolase (TIGR01457 family)